MGEADAILLAAQTLADTIKNSELYRSYRRSRIRVEGKPDLADRLHHYKKTQAAYEFKRLQNQPVTFDEEKYLSHLHAELSLNEDTGRFLAQEDQLLEAYRQILDILNEACEIDMF